MSTSIERILDNPRVKGIARSVLPQSIRKAVAASLIARSRSVKRAAISRGWIGGLDDIQARLLATNVHVRSPLILISQVQRSGGSLLSQLLDGHPNILAHPQELKIGYPNKEQWPPISPTNSAESNFDILFEHIALQMLQNGYSKGRADRTSYNFFLVPSVQRAIFLNFCKNYAPSSDREILDAYFSSYFNGWLNYNGNLEEACYISGFVPRLIYDPNNMQRFFAAYPDGYIISVLRSPYSWYPSAKLHSKKDQFGTIEKAAESWNMSVVSTLREKGNHPDRVIILLFDDLISRTRDTMTALCDILDLEFSEKLCFPTFNGMPMAPNTSFEKLERGRVSNKPIEREGSLEKAEREFLEEKCGDLFTRALAHVTIRISDARA